MDVTDEQMVADALTGDAEALTNLVRRYDRSMIWFFYRHCGDWELARDLRQELFCKMLGILPQFDRRGVPFRAWFYRVARNLAIDRLHRRRTVPLQPLDDSDDSGGYAVEVDRPSHHAERNEFHVMLMDLLSELPELDRSIIAMKHDDGLTFEEIGITLGLPVSSVKSRMYRAFDRMRVELESRGYQWESFMGA